MHKTELYITINSTENAYKCLITQTGGHWDCILYQQDFQYKTIHGKSIIEILKSLASHLDELGSVDVVQGKNADRIHIAILENHIRISRSNRLLRTLDRENLA